MPSTADAVRASVACARALGLPADAPVVVAEGYSVRVRLGPVLTRVVTEGVRLRGAPTPWLVREVAAAQHLAERGVSVARPWQDPGPHDGAGLPVTLWHWVEQVPGEVGQAELGALVGRLHDALVDLDADLPLLAGPLTDVRAALALSDDDALHRVAAQVLPLADGWPRRPLHGDVHPGNVVLTGDGPRWVDLEDVCVGPVEWDLASTSLSDEAVAAYPGDVDPARLADCRDLRRLQVLAGTLTDDLSTPDLRPRVLAALAHRL